MGSLIKKCIFLSFTLLLLVSASAAQLDVDGTDEYMLVDPPQNAGEERISVFLVMSDQPAADASVQMMKTTAVSQQTMTMDALARMDPLAAETAQSYWIVNAICVKADPKDLDRLASLPGVDHIERDFTVTVTDPVIQTMDEVSPNSIVYVTEESGMVWSADFIGAPSVWETGNLGAGINISIVDTGIDGNHPAFGDRIVAWADFVGTGSTPYDDNGHGTHCAGTSAGGVVETTTYDGNTIDVVLGVAPGANLMGAKVLDGNGDSESFDPILRGVQWSVENGADIVSMSLGGFYGPWNAFSSQTNVGMLEANSSVEVAVEAASSYNTNFEPQFIIGAVYGGYAGSAVIDEITNGGNVTFTVTDAGGNIAEGSAIDWLGFDTQSDIYYFKAPYASNVDAWSGNWKATLTNAGNESFGVEKILIGVCYQSNGNDIVSTTLNNVMNLGTTVVVSAGNNGAFGHGTIGYPGTAEDVITVGATDYMMDYRATFSSMGPVDSSNPYQKPDVVAPGVGIISAYRDGQYAIMDGTSMSAPAVAGTAALMLAGNNSLSSANIKDALMSSAIHIDENGDVVDTMAKNSVYGAGRVDAYAAVNVTGGLGTTPIGDGVVYELFGGGMSGQQVYCDVLPVTAVTWNVTGGVPMTGEEVTFSLWDTGSSPYVYDNTTVVTDASGNALVSMDLSGYDDSTWLDLRITWNDRKIKQSFYKAVAPTPTQVGNFIYEYNYYWAITNDTIQIKYPLLNPDGSPYTNDVVLKLESGIGVYNETITPVAGVVGTDIDLSTIYAGNEYSNYNIYLDDEYVGYLEISPTMDEEWYNVFLSPGTAICSPGSSIDISAILLPEHSGMAGSMKTGSTTATATVVTFSETQINALTTDARTALLGGELKTLDKLDSKIQGMDVSTVSETFEITNGIGLYNLDMPVDAYLALVYVTTRYSMEGYNEASVMIYGEITPWIQHSTTDGVFRDAFNKYTSIYPTTSEWGATWDQQTYSVVPSDEATLGFEVYTYTLDEVTNEYIEEPAIGEIVYLYTGDGAFTATTDAEGRCRFTVTPDEVENAGYEYLAVTGGFDVYGTIYSDSHPLNPLSGSRIAAGLITLESVAPSWHGYIRPDQATRSVAVAADNDNRTITLTSVGPSDESIHEMGMFTFDQFGPHYYSNGTFDAATVEFDRTISKTVEVPEVGMYRAEFSILNPADGTLQSTTTTFVDTDYNLTYEVMDNVLQGTSVPVTFTLTDQNGNPITGAKVLFKMGAAAGFISEYGMQEYYQSEIDPRDENIWTYLGYYPDPYSQVYTGLTDANGQAELTFIAPTNAEQAYRLGMGSASGVCYDVLCVHNDQFVAISGGSYMPVAGELPDFVPIVDAPHVVKINRDDTVRVDDLGLYVKNVGTVDFVYNGTDVKVVAEVASFTKDTLFNYGILKGETAEVLYINVEQSAQDYGIDPETTSLPQDKSVKVTVNPEPRAVDELRYDNNVINHNLRVTAPDLVTEIIAPSITTQFTAIPIGVKVTNAGEVPSVATTLTYTITGKANEPGITIIALEPGESTMIWRNATLTTGTYDISATVNPGHVTDYETLYNNNIGTKTIVSYDNPPASIVLPPDAVYVPGTGTTLPIVVKGVTDLAGYQMTFRYDPSVINVTNVISGDIALNAKNLNHAKEGYVTFAGGQTISKTGTVTIATLVVDVIGSTGDDTTLALSDVELFDGGNGFKIPVVVTNGSATLMLYGDANADGSVNQADTLQVLRWVVGIDTDKPTSGTRLLQTDVTKNSVVDVGDAMFIAQKNVKLRDDYFNIL